MSDGPSPYAEFDGFFSPSERAVLRDGHGLPLIEDSLERLCLLRIGNVVLNGLTDTITETSPLRTQGRRSSVRHPFLTTEGSTLDVAIGILPAIQVNDSWAVHASFGVPLAGEDMELSHELYNLNPAQEIHDPRGIVFASLRYLPSAVACEKLDDESHFFDPHETVYDEKLLFTRIHHDFEWEPRTDRHPLSKQIAFMARLGTAASIRLPYA